MSRLHFVLTAALLAGCSGTAPPHAGLPAAPAARADGEQWAQVDRQVESWLARRRIPGLSLAVIEDGHIVHARGFGVTAVQGGKRVTAATRFQAASISKAVAAATLLRLVEQGALGLDEPVNRHLGEWKLADANGAADGAATLRGLLSHTAGVNVPSFDGAPAGEAPPTLRDVLEGRPASGNPPVRVQPAARGAYAYSGGGYTVAQQLAEEVGKRPFAQLVRRLVLVPAGMRMSGFEQPLPARLAAEAASGHRLDRTILPGGARVYPALAAGGLWSTAPDLARFLIAVRASARGEKPALLPAALASDALSDQVRSAAPGGRRWGLGFRLAGEGDGLCFGHDGRNAGFDSEMSISLAGGNGVVLMANANDNSAMFASLVGSIGRVRGWRDFPAAPERGDTRAVPPQLAAEVEGLYHLPSGEPLAIARRGSGLFRLTDGLPDVEYRAGAGGALLSMESEERLDLRRDPQGRLVGIERVRSGAPVRSARIGPLPERLAPLAEPGAAARAEAVLAALAAGGAAVRASPLFSGGFIATYGDRPPIPALDDADSLAALFEGPIAEAGVAMNGDEVSRVAYYRFVNQAMSIEATLLLFLTAAGRIAEVTLLQDPLAD